jgi:hypothetical protein
MRKTRPLNKAEKAELLSRPAMEETEFTKGLEAHRKKTEKEPVLRITKKGMKALEVKQGIGAPEPVAPIVPRGTPKTGAVRTHQSNSSIETYIDCGWRYFFRYVKGLKRPPSFSMIQGGAFSEASEVNFKQKIQTGEDLKLSVLEDALMEALDRKILEREKDIIDTNVEVKQDEKKEISEIRNEARLALDIFYQRACRNIQPIQAEYELKIPMQDLGVDGGKFDHVLLFMDLLAKPIDPLTGKWLSRDKKAKIILDNKLTARTPDWDSAKKSQQLTLYAWALECNEGVLPHTTGLIYTVKKKDPEVIVQLARKTKEDVDCYRLRMKEVLKAIENEVWIPADPSSWKCSSKFCGYWDICPVRPRVR